MNIRAADFVQNLRGLTMSEKTVAQAMAIHADYENAECYMSMDLLASEAGIKNRETASRVVKRLEAHGVIAADGGHSKGGRGKTTTYTFTFTINRDSGVTLTPTYEARNCDSTVTLNSETVTQNAETVTPQSHEGIKALSLLPQFGVDSADGESAVHEFTAALVSDVSIFPSAADVSTSNRPSTRCSSQQAASQTEPPSAVTRKRVSPTISNSASDEQRLGLQAAVSRIAKKKLGNHRHIPKNLTEKFELLGVAHGVTVVSRDFREWCDENPVAKRAMAYPIHEYIKVVDSRFCSMPVQSVEALRIAVGVDELGELYYELTNTLTTKKQKNQIAEALKEISAATLKTALTFFIENLPAEPTSVVMSSFWSIRNLKVVIATEYKQQYLIQESREYADDLRKVKPTKPMQHDLPALKRRVGTLPFTQRLMLSHQGYSPCPFHNGDSDMSFHVERQDDGVAIGTCFSNCAKSFDAIAFVEKFDKVSIGESIRKLVSIGGDIEAGTASAGLPPKPKPLPMTIDCWSQAGREVTDADVAKLSASRPNSKTPSAATLNTMGFKIGEKYEQVFIVAPYRMGDTFYTLKARNIAIKKFLQENAVSQHGLFNIDAVTAGCDVYVVESELDAAVLHEAGYTAVSVINSLQKGIEPDVMTHLLMAGRIFLVGDMDAGGQTCMTHFASLLPAEKVRRMAPPQDMKDVGEWAMQAHFQEQFESAIQTASRPTGEQS